MTLSKPSAVFVLLFSLLAFGSFGAAHAATLNVAPSGATYSKIQDAINAATTGDVVLVAAGTYKESIDFKGKAITVRGASGATLTKIDGSTTPTVSVVKFVTSETRSAVLQGFTVTGFNATGSSNVGGGIYINLASPLIQDVIIEGNRAYYGAAAYVTGSSAKPLFLRVTVRNNFGSYDNGGIYLANGEAEVSGSRFTGQTTGAAGYGGALYVGGGVPYIHNNLFAGNSADGRGGAVYFSSSITGTSAIKPVKLHNNVFSNNRTVASTASAGGGHLYASGTVYTQMLNNVFQHAVQGCGVYVGSTTTYATFRYNDVFENYSTGTTLCADAATNNAMGGTGNITTNPSFTAYSNDGNTGNDDFRPAVGSPLINAGDPALLDLDGSRSDIGLYGGPAQTADADTDGLDDIWEGWYGLSTSSSNAQTDSDGDGLLDTAEYTAGTHPLLADTDADGVEDPDEITAGQNPLDALDNRPVAAAGADKVVEFGQTATLVGSGTDPNNDPLTYRWTLSTTPGGSALTTASLTGANQATCSFTPDAYGIYTLSLVVNDGNIDSPADTVDVVVPRVLQVPSAYSTIQAAIDAATNGDRVEVAAGTYTERIDFKGKRIRVRGAGRGVTILDANLAGTAVTFKTAETSQSVLEEMTISRGKVTGDGGCVLITNATPTLQNLVLTGCEATDDGGGIYASWTTGTLTLTNVRVSASKALYWGGGVNLQGGGTSAVTGLEVSSCTTTSTSLGYGAGIYISGGTHTLTDIDLGANVSGYSGGGLYVSTGTVTVTQGFVHDNLANGSAGSGGGIYAAGTTTLRHGVLVNNGAASGGGLAVAGTSRLEQSVVASNIASASGGNIFVAASTGNLTGVGNVVYKAIFKGGITALGTLTWTYNDVFGNTGGDYTGVSQTGQNGNVSVDPGFLDFSADLDSSNDSYNLDVDSPLIDAGDPARLDPDLTRSDIGLYGGATSLDLNFDGDDSTVWQGDCDDWSAAIPAAFETVNGIDDNCDGLVDNETEEFDDDNDGYTELEGDCDDEDPAASPGEVEIENGVDDNCDGDIDEGSASFDDDGDGYSEDASVGGSEDCDDDDPDVTPGATEAPNGIDDNCDGVVDEGTVFYDDDGDGRTENGGDCDDGSDVIYSGAPELLDGLDNDCDGLTDERTAAYDDDGDGYSEDASVGGAADCDDTNATVSPAATERPDQLDNNCDGDVDEGTSLFDDDGDGYTEAGGDCDDDDADTHPNVPEEADGLDNDCDGRVDEGTDAFDDDGDGYSEDGSIGGAADCDDSTAVVSPAQPERADGRDNNCDGDVDEGTLLGDDDDDGATEAEGDCQDDDASIYPGATEAPDGKDNDCDGREDEGTALYDDDGDGASEEDGDCDDTTALIHPDAQEIGDGEDNDCDGDIDEDVSSVDQDGDGASALQGDCDETDADVNPDAEELLDGIDNNCDGDVDEGTAAFDDDGDGTSEADGDCNDAVPQIYSGALEIADGLDNDCDGDVDEGTHLFDDDEDGRSEVEGDCNDADPAVYGGAEEIADGLDNNCNGTVDEGSTASDDDNDGFSEEEGDCDDASAVVYPNAPELGDGEDNDCDGDVDEDVDTTDRDGDGYSALDGDCDETDSDVHPNAAEVLDSDDNDCDGTIDEGTRAFDDDGDGYSEDAGDCDDDDEERFPGAEEVGDAVDNNCNGTVDEGTDAYDDDGDGVTEQEGDCDDGRADVSPNAAEVDDGRDNNCDGAIDEGGEATPTPTPTVEPGTPTPTPTVDGTPTPTPTVADDTPTQQPGTPTDGDPVPTDTPASPTPTDGATPTQPTDEAECACAQSGEDRGAAAGAVMMLLVALGLRRRR